MMINSLWLESASVLFKIKKFLLQVDVRSDSGIGNRLSHFLAI